MQPIDMGIAMLVLHGLLGGFDTLYNHEWDARLPQRPSAALELKLHAGRSGLYVPIFIGLAWYEWHGAAVWALVTLVIGEFTLSLVDSVVEDRTRRVAATERVVHMLLGVTTGAWAGFVFLTAFTDWIAQPTGWRETSYGIVSWLLTAFGLAVGASAARDALAARRLDREARFLPPRDDRPRPALAGE
jgi:hypothetical protein